MKIKFVEPKNIFTEKYKGLVYDLTVKDAHSFTCKGIVLHNSICKTRIQTGCGAPTLYSLMDCFKVKQQFPNVAMIADGGIRSPGDIVKALAAGADAVIIGSLFAGTDESPGKVIKTNDGQLWKNYRGMASREVQEEKRGGLKKGTAAEGVSALIPYKGDVRTIVEELIGGLKSGMSIVNARTLKELSEAELIEITNAGIIESQPHIMRK